VSTSSLSLNVPGMHWPKRTAFLVSVVAAVAAPAATPHGGVAPKGFVTTVDAVRPAVPGLQVTIIGGDERMRMVNRSGQTVIIHGYDGEPYLRLGPDALYVNNRSPAVWLNADRLGATPVPPTVDPRAAPEWQRIRTDQTVEWHEHRAQWMSSVLPPRVLRNPDERHFVFDWVVPGSVDGAPLAISGKLEYVPAGAGSGSSFPVGPVVLVVTAVVALLVIGLLLVARRRLDEEEEDRERLEAA
jgi:hypothetical protein